MKKMNGRVSLESQIFGPGQNLRLPGVPHQTLRILTCGVETQQCRCEDRSEANLSQEGKL